MRHFIYVVWLLPFLGVAALGADDLPKPKKDPSAPPAAFPDIGPRPSSAAAVKFYREAAAIKDDPFVADCARCQLDNLTWRKGVESQLAQMRQPWKGLEIKP
jgi:hypothetical protein